LKSIRSLGKILMTDFIEALQNIDQVAYKIDCMEEEMYGKER